MLLLSVTTNAYLQVVVAATAAAYLFIKKAAASKQMPIFLTTLNLHF